MKKNNALFLALAGISVVLIGAIMADNITSMPGSYGEPAAVTAPPNTGDTRATEAVRQKFTRLGLVLHEGKYWKNADE